MAEYKTLSGLDLDIGGYTESVTRSKQTLEEVSRKNRGIGAKPETETVELDNNFLEGIAQLFRDNGYEPKQPSEDTTTTPKDEVLDEYSKLMKSEIIQDAMKEVSTLGESPNKLEDIYTTIDTYTATFDDQPIVDSEGETLDITQTQPQRLISRPSDAKQVDRTEVPSMAEEAEPTEEVRVDSKILSPRFLNAIGITGSLTEKGVQSEVKKVLKEQGISDEEATSIIDNSLSADEVQPRFGKEYTESMFTVSGNSVTPNMDKIKEFAKDTYSNPVKAAAFVATVQAESGKGLVEKGYTKDKAIEIFVDRNARADGTLGPRMTKRKADILALPDDYTSDDIFNIVYGGRLGNRAGTNDGSTYKGRGILQITGRKNYKRVGNAIGVDLVNNPELLETDKDVMLKASLAYLRDSGFIFADLTQDRLASIVGHSDKNKKEAKKRWKSTQKFYKEMYNEDMPTSSRAVDSAPTSSPRPRIKPAGIMERPPF